MTLKLNIGAGSTTIEGFTPIDRKLGSEAYPLDYADNSVDEIRASHVLEHFGWGEVGKVLADWVRVLKPGGLIKISVPDVDKCIAERVHPHRLHYVMGGQNDEDDFHKSAFAADTLPQWMARAGIVNIEPWASDNTDTASMPISLNLQGIKSNKASAVNVKIAALVSIPRLGFNEHWGCVHEALRPFEIPVHRFTGAFWGHGMQRGLNSMIEAGIDWALCLDYDTMFSQEHVDRLLDAFGRFPHIDALAAMQCKRRNDKPLMSCGMASEVDYNGEPIKVTTAHFGFTLLRLASVKDIPKPWFKSEPNEDNEWEDGRLDDDIFFWHQLRAAGKILCVDPAVRVGHLELVVSQFDDSMRHELVTMPQWHEQHNSGVVTCKSVEPQQQDGEGKPCT